MLRTRMDEDNLVWPTLRRSPVDQRAFKVVACLRFNFEGESDKAQRPVIPSSAAFHTSGW